MSKSIIEIGGAGYQMCPEAVQVDVREQPGVDIICDARNLREKFKRNTVQGIYAANLLEHIPRAEIEEMLATWWEVLEKGGFIDVVVPDLEAIMDSWKDMPWKRVLDALYGAQDYKENFHYNGFTEKTLMDLMGMANFVNMEISHSVYDYVISLRIKAYKYEEN